MHSKLNNLAGKYVGLIFILVSVLANPYSIGFYYVSSGKLNGSLTILVIAFEMFMLVLGLFFIVRKPSFSLNLGVSLTILLLCLAMTEIVAMTTQLFVPQKFLERQRLFYDFYQPDSLLGFRPQANLKRFNISWMDEDVFGEYSTDSYGFRNNTSNYSKSRIHLIGDSFTFGAWVARDSTFCGIVESELGESIINFGVGGYGFSQYQTLINTFVDRFNPETVILCVFANDLQTPHSPDYIRDYYRQSGWSTFQEPSYRDRSLFTRLFELPKTTVFAAKSSLYKEIPDGIFLFRERGADLNYLSANKYKEVEEKFAEIVSVLHAKEVQLLVFLFPSKESAYKTEYEKLFPANYLQNEEKGYERLEKLAAEKGIPCVNLTSILRSQVEKGKRPYFNKDPHWNVFGHKVVAKAMLDQLDIVNESTR